MNVPLITTKSNPENFNSGPARCSRGVWQNKSVCRSTKLAIIRAEAGREPAGQRSDAQDKGVVPAMFFAQYLIDRRTSDVMGQCFRGNRKNFYFPPLQIRHGGFSD